MTRLGVQTAVTAGVVSVLGAAMVLVPADHSPCARPDPPSHRAYGLSAAVLPWPGGASGESVEAVERVSAPARKVSPGVGTVVPERSPTELVSVASIGGGIIAVYDTVEPWVAWGFDVAQYAVGWVPVVGWLAPQIGILYDFGESIVQSAVYNFAFWIGGDVAFFEGLGNIARDSWNALVQLGVDELNWILPPLPPWPPIFAATLAAGDDATPAVAAAVAADVDATEDAGPATEAPAEQEVTHETKTPEVTSPEGVVDTDDAQDADVTDEDVTADDVTEEVTAGDVIEEVTAADVIEEVTAADVAEAGQDADAAHDTEASVASATDAADTATD